MASYTSEWRGWRSFLNTVVNDVRSNHQDPLGMVDVRIAEARKIERMVFGETLVGADVLDVGPGPVPIQLVYFAQRNRAIGMDVNRIIKHRTPCELYRLARESGKLRAVKTLGKWVLGFDGRLRRALAERLGVERMPWPMVFQMDAQQMAFRQSSFDFVYSRSVFQHVRDPEAAVREIRRVLRPGGSFFIGIHLWTAPNGYTYIKPPSWQWPHLRGMLREHEMDQSRNRWRISQWRALFEEVFPGSAIVLDQPTDPEMVRVAKTLQSNELSHYSVEELTSWGLCAYGRTPPDS